MSSVLPALGPEAVVAIDGKTIRRTGKVGATPLHLVSAFAAGAGLVPGQMATAKKSNERTAIPMRLQTLALDGCIVTIGAMGTHANVAQAIRDRKADYVLAVKDDQPTLADSIRDLFALFKSAPPNQTPHGFFKSIEKSHGRIKHRRCFVFDQLDSLHNPTQWPELNSFMVIESERTIKGKSSLERRYYISSLRPDAERAAGAIRPALGGREQSALVHGYGLCRRPDARPHRPCRSQPRRPQAHHHEPHPPRSRPTPRRHQGPPPYRRPFRRLSSPSLRARVNHAIALAKAPPLVAL